MYGSLSRRADSSDGFHKNMLSKEKVATCWDICIVCRSERRGEGALEDKVSWCSRVSCSKGHGGHLSDPDPDTAAVECCNSRTNIQLCCRTGELSCERPRPVKLPLLIPPLILVLDLSCIERQELAWAAGTV